MITLKKLKILLVLQRGENYGMDIAEKSATIFPEGPLKVTNIYGDLVNLVVSKHIERVRLEANTGGGRGRQYYKLTEAGEKVIQAHNKAFTDPEPAGIGFCTFKING